jgi:mono/diheme cytochrome c family protein
MIARSFRWLTTLVITLVTILLLTGESALAQSAAERQGFWFARLHCAQCHAIEAVGESPLAMAPPFRTLRLKYPVQDLQRPLAKGIHPKMPLFHLTPAQTIDLMAYLKSLEAAPPPAKTKGN